MRALYITYDGVLEPLGASQVLPYVEALARRGVRYTLLSFEKPRDLEDAPRVESLRRRLTEGGVVWVPLRYHKRPSALATAFDILHGAFVALRAVLRSDICVVHARSYVAAVMAWLVTRVTSSRMLFDMRGFWVDERVEGGLWRAGGRLYRTAKAWERRLLRDADGIVVLSDAAVGHLASLAGVPVDAPVRVVPTCVDLERFRPRGRRSARQSLGLPEDAFVLIYVGSLGTWYLGAETFRLAQAVGEVVPHFVFVVLTREVAEANRLVPEALGERTRIVTVSHDEVPGWLAAADAGLALVRPSFSKVASCPTKLGEYLACGLPVVSTTGIGDVDRILNSGGGVVLPDTREQTLKIAAQALVERAGDPATAAVCRTIAGEVFSLEGGVARLEELYAILGADAC